MYQYRANPELFLESLPVADGATQILMDMMANIARHAETTGLNDYSPHKSNNGRVENSA
ncbi:MAG: hypothetical protein ACRERV_00585 [Methylococcales bacterium]